MTGAAGRTLTVGELLDEAGPDAGITVEGESVLSVERAGSGVDLAYGEPERLCCQCGGDLSEFEGYTEREERRLWCGDCVAKEHTPEPEEVSRYCGTCQEAHDGIYFTDEDGTLRCFECTARNLAENYPDLVTVSEGER